jgi:hypothetical protein
LLLIDDVRDFLRKREALLVHFNTPMSLHPKGYPHDLFDVLKSRQWAMCYSTILRSDLGPTLYVVRVFGSKVGLS